MLPKQVRGSLSGNYPERNLVISGREKNINVLDLVGVKLAILPFTEGKLITAIHLQMDKMTAPSYLVKMGESHSQ